MIGDPSKITIRLVPGDVAPRRDPKEITELACEVAVITERGTNGGLPIVDLELTDEHGRKFYAMITGRVLTGIASAVAGVNLRNHGTPVP